MPSSVAGYGHSARGHNLKNLKDVGGTKAVRLAGGDRVPADWQREVDDTIQCFKNETMMTQRMLAGAAGNIADGTARMGKGLDRTDCALASKISKTQAQKARIEKAALEVELEQQHLSRAMAKARRLRARKASQLHVNEQRLQARSHRPSRELTNDNVQLHLAAQQDLLTAFVHKLERALSVAARAAAKLAAAHAGLSKDAADKASAIAIDRAALEATAADAAAQERRGGLAPATRPDGLLYPHAWAAATAERIASAARTVEDSAGLRRAMAAQCAENGAALTALGRDLEASMQERIGATRDNRQALEKQLQDIEDERRRAGHQRERLLRASVSKQAPGALAQHRYQMRRQRPPRERVHDEVEDALARELFVIDSHGAALTARVSQLDAQLLKLAGAAATVTANLEDKRAGEEVDVRCALLDGRRDTTERPMSVATTTFSRPSSVGSRTTAAASDSLSRIVALEAELSSAKVEREALEASVASLKSAAAA